MFHFKPEGTRRSHVEPEHFCLLFWALAARSFGDDIATTAVTTCPQNHLKSSQSPRYSLGIPWRVTQLVSLSMQRGKITPVADTRAKDGGRILLVLFHHSLPFARTLTTIESHPKRDRYKEKRTTSLKGIQAIATTAQPLRSVISTFPPPLVPTTQPPSQTQHEDSTSTRLAPAYSKSGPSYANFGPSIA